ncbi:hypothetical protein R3P38DRAFT_2922494 [Favolaschia claudopus]|uniref:Uncharacterized protein n=1 Tax=Favolaschia claudopus TaxID=2862362 RepID=A0AAW0C4H9_9AGAR
MVRLSSTLLLFAPFGAAVADLETPSNSAAILGNRDVTTFFAAMSALQNAANVFKQDFCCSGTTANVTALQIIAGHIKACSDAFDAALIELASINPTSLSTPPLSASNAATLNSTFVPSIQTAILNNLNTLQAGKAFFEFVNNNRLLLVMYCHWVGVLAVENKSFLRQLVVSAPSSDYSSSWASLLNSATSAYTIWLTEDGFNCGGLF